MTMTISLNHNRIMVKISFNWNETTYDDNNENAWEWCCGTLVSINWDYRGEGRYYFKNESDAIIFKLKFGI